MTKKKDEKYIVFGSTVLNVPAKMIDIDKKGKEHLYNTTTKKHNIATRRGKTAIVMKTNASRKIARVPKTTVRVKSLKRMDVSAPLRIMKSVIEVRGEGSTRVGEEIARELASPDTSPSASILQNRIRATLQRNRLLSGKDTVSKLQGNIRAALANRNMNKQLTAANKIRNFFKNYKATLPARELKVSLRRERNRKRLQQIAEQFKAPVALTEYRPVYKPQLTEEEKQFQEERKSVRTAINEARKEADKKYDARQQRLKTLTKILTETMPVGKSNKDTNLAITTLQGLIRRRITKPIR